MARAALRRQTGNSDRGRLVHQGIDRLVALGAEQQCQSRHGLIAEAVEGKPDGAVEGSVAIGPQGVSSQVLHAVGRWNQWTRDPVNQLLSGIESSRDVHDHRIAEQHPACRNPHGKRLGLSRSGQFGGDNRYDERGPQNSQAVRRSRRPKKAASGSA